MKGRSVFSTEPVEKGKVWIAWMGQAGFYLKNSQGLRIGVDPYLSDLCQRLVGYKRITPPVCAMEAFDPDVLLLSHEHPDHCDTDFLKHLAKRASLVRIFAPGACREMVLSSGVKPEQFTQLEAGQKLELPGVRVEATAADHGAECPGALGFLLDFGGITVYFAGDTAYSPEILQPALKAKPEIALLPINGEFGNLSAWEAARLAADLDCRVLLPCHYWTFVEHGSSPKDLLSASEGKPWRLDFLAQGEGRIYDNRDKL